jgi:pyruvate dehydrogenase E1 component alpha subunit
VCLRIANANVDLVQEKGQLLENVFADPKGFGVSPGGGYRYEQPGFSSGTAAVS